MDFTYADIVLERLRRKSDLKNIVKMQKKLKNLIGKKSFTFVSGEIVR